jgi:signal transduction histidine kinase
MVLVFFAIGINLTAHIMMYRGFDSRLNFLARGFEALMKSSEIDSLATLEKFISENNNEFKNPPPPMENLWIKLIDNDNNILFQSVVAEENPVELGPGQFQEDPFSLTLEGLDRDSHFSPLPHGIAPVRVRYTRIGSGVDSFYAVMALPVSDEIRSMVHFHRASLIAILIAFVFVFITGLYITWLSLRPIAAMRNRLDKINAENLDERIPMPNPDDELGRLAHSINNLFDRVDSSFKIQTRFISDVSHEFKTPLSILRLNEEKLLNLPDLNDDAFDTINSSIEILYSLDFLVQKLLYLSRLEQDRCPFHPELVNPLEIVSKVHGALSLIAEGKDLTFSMNDSRTNSNKEMPADPELLYMALFNIVENSLKYTVHGSVIISLSSTDNNCRIDVSDTGIGITSNKLPLIFDRFYRADESREHGRGYGIGLSIVRRIVDLHQGHIEVESQVDSGTTISIFLPGGEKIQTS